MALSQTQIIRRTEIFVTNDCLPEAQAVIAGVGYDAAALAVGQGLITAVKTGQASTKELLAAQKTATRAEKDARTAAQKEVISLSETARLLFANDNATLTALGLQTQYETVIDAESGEEKQVAKRPSEATADVIARWRQLVTNAEKLEAGLLAQLTAAGWGVTRLTAASTLVEAYATADTNQQSAIQAYQQTSNQYTADIESLRQWYSRARNLSTLAIKDADPTNQQNLRELLGLDG